MNEDLNGINPKYPFQQFHSHYVQPSAGSRPNTLNTMNTNSVPPHIADEDLYFEGSDVQTRSPQVQAQLQLYPNGNLSRLHQQSVTTTMPPMPYWNNPNKMSRNSFHSQMADPRGFLPHHLSSVTSSQYPLDAHQRHHGPMATMVERFGSNVGPMSRGHHPVRFSGDSFLDEDDDNKSRDVDQIEISQMSAPSHYKVTPQMQPLQPQNDDGNHGNIPKPTLFMITNANGDIVAEHSSRNQLNNGSKRLQQRARGRHRNESALSTQIPATRCLSPL